MSCPVLRVLVGSPAVGKSSWCGENTAWLGTVLSLDKTRALLGEGEHDQSVNAEVVDYVRHRAREALISGRDVTIDATGAAVSDRATWVSLATETGADPIAVTHHAPLGVCLRRNALRERQVPAGVLVAKWLSVRSTNREQLHAEGFVDVAAVEAGIDDDELEDLRDWRHFGELSAGQTFRNPGISELEEWLQVRSAEPPDHEGAVAITTQHAQPLVLGADRRVEIATGSDAGKG